MKRIGDTTPLIAEISRLKEQLQNEREQFEVEIHGLVELNLSLNASSTMFTIEQVREVAEKVSRACAQNRRCKVDIDAILKEVKG